MNKCKLSNFIEFDPSEKLEKNQSAKKVSMDCLMPYTREITSYCVSKYSGGAKFRNCDTIVARITPCLENGKTAYVNILKQNEVAFGSTEFIVLRSKDRISDSKFIYYLSISEWFRNIAIKSMVGSSGRQRVQKNVLQETLFNLPPLEEQKAIADVLASLDDKIELNNKINKNLEEQAQALFKRWFVDFEFPNEDSNPYKSSGGEMIDSELGEIPKDWEVKMFEELFDFLEGPGIRNWQYVQKGKGVKFMNIRCIQNNDIGITSANMISEEEAYGKYKHFLLQAGDVVVSTSGTLGRWAIVREEHLPLCLNTSIIRFQARNKTWTSFMTMYLSSKDFINHLETKASGSVQKNFGPMHLRQIEVIAPTQKLVEKLDKVLNIIICKLLDIKTENQKLAELRDYLLPKLMSGEIRVKQ